MPQVVEPIWILGAAHEASHVNMTSWDDLTVSPCARTGAAAFARAGIAPHDVILNLADQPVKGARDVLKVVSASDGKEIEVKLLRAGKPVTVKVVPNKAKSPLGTLQFPSEEVEIEVKGRDLIEGIPKTVRISSHEIRKALEEPVKEIADGVKRTLEGTPPELAADIVDRGIVMTGGGSLLRGLDLYLREKTNLPINVVEDPLTCVVLGAGKVLDDIERYEKVLLRRVRR